MGQSSPTATWSLTASPPSPILRAIRASYTYDIAGSLDIFTHFNGIITTYSHDAASRLIGMGSIVSDYQFTLDVNGNRIHSSRNEPLSASPAAASISYGYNAKKNRLLSAGSTSYAYDDEGQLSTAGSTVHTFDYDHRLAGIGSDVQFTYDGGGNRLSATRAGLTTRYIYDPWGNLLAEADASNQITRKYIYGKGLLALVTPANRYCYHFDATGHTVALTDMTGAVVNSYAYEPFGQILAEQETIAQPFKYVGQYGVMAEPSGLYYMRARYYDPSVGRFISEDPLGFGGGDVNLSAYVLNNPINAIDPTGLITDSFTPRVMALIAQGEISEAVLIAQVSGISGLLAKVYQLQNALSSLVNKYPVKSFKCDSLAKEVFNAFNSIGANPQLLQITDKYGAQFFKDNKGVTFATTCFHQVVQVGNTVFDALTGPGGMKYVEYIKMIESFGIIPIITKR